MARKATEHSEISEGFPEEEAMCDPGLEGQTGGALGWVASTPVY